MLLSMHSGHPFFGPFLGASCLAAALVACGASNASNEDLLPRLRAALDAPVASNETSHAHSRLVEDVVKADSLLGKSRQEVLVAIGKGEECSLHPRCDEHGFDDTDWFYQVGQMGGAQPPYLIVGFNREGRVDRTWYLRTH